MARRRAMNRRSTNRKEKQELEKLLQQYKQGIDPKPGCAKRTVHKIVTDGIGPIRQ